MAVARPALLEGSRPRGVYTRHDIHGDLVIDAKRFGDEKEFLQRFLEENPFALDAGYAGRVNATGAVYISLKPLFYDGAYHFEDRASGILLTHDGIHLNEFGAHKFGLYLRDHYPLPH